MTISNTEKIDLLIPVVTSDGREISAVYMRRPKVIDQLTVSKRGLTAQEQEIELFANLTELTPATIQLLDMADYVELQEVYNGFLSSRKENSKKDS